MATIEVLLEASYGCNCMGYGYGSEETIQIEVSNDEIEILKKINSNKVSCEEVLEAINGGETVLQSIHDKIETAFYNMVEEYWLFEAYNECLEDSLSDSMENDIESGEYTPMPFDDFIEKFKSGNIDFESLELGYFDDIDENYDFEDEEDLEYKYNGYILNGYYDWVKEHDHDFVAERVGLDLDACRDDEVNYTITIQ